MSKFKLSDTDRAYLGKLIKTGKKTGKELVRAYVLLALDKGERQGDISRYYHVGRSTIWRAKDGYLAGGLERALNDRARPGAPVKYNDRAEAEIIALACSQCPEGRSRWTVRLLAQHAKKIAGMEDINRESVRLVLKKTGLSLG